MQSGHQTESSDQHEQRQTADEDAALFLVLRVGIGKSLKKKGGHQNHRGHVQHLINVKFHRQASEAEFLPASILIIS